MKKLSLIFSILPCMLVSCAQKDESMNELTDRVFDIAVKQCIAMDSRLAEDELPKSVRDDGTNWNSDYQWWCSGFFPGTAWYVFEYTGNDEIKAIAEKNTKKLAMVPENVDNHDIGFMIWCSYGNAYRLTSDTTWLPVIKAGAEKLSKRFNEKCGVIQSWKANPEIDRVYPVIIDNMMNLELLEESSKLFDNPSYSVIAQTHARTTIRNHFRPDYSSYHVVDYNPETGGVRKKVTAQGYSDDSAWARGQAWGLYGYTMMYRETGDEIFLNQAEHIADFIIPHLPCDGITYWDFNAPEIPNALRDASAAAVMSSAFVELSNKTKDAERATRYLCIAEKILRTLASDKYLAQPGTNGNFLLRHSVGHFHKNYEVDAPLTYADYYFLEALLRYKAKTVPQE